MSKLSEAVQFFPCNAEETVIKCNVKTEYGKQQVPVDFCQLGKGKQVQILYDLVTVSMEYISTALCGDAPGNWEGRFCMLIYKPGNLPVVGTGT